MQPIPFVFEFAGWSILMPHNKMIPILAPTVSPVRRLPTYSLPTYRFVPGLQQHPNVSPTHGFPEIQLEDCWAYGWDLYDNHYWWEAHEVWERLWKALPLESAVKWGNDHPRRLYIQGHILLSASRLLEHMGRKYIPMRTKAYVYIEKGHPY